jgi:hypothetical protein
MKWTIAAGAAALLLTSAWTASAATYTIEHSHSQGVGYANVSFNGGASTVSSYLGRFIMEPIPVTELPPQYPIYPISTVHGLESGFFSYCIEPLQSIGVGHGAAYQYEFSLGPLVGMDGFDAGDVALVNELFGLYSPLLKNDPTGPYTGGTFRTAAAALQLAVWKINLDRATETLGAWDFSSGLMRIAPGAVPLETGASLTADAVAVLMLNSLTGSGPTAMYLEGLENPTIQDLIIQSDPATPSKAATWGSIKALYR